MPIRKELRHLYRGPKWQAIRARILERAGYKCELCGAPNWTVVLRVFGWWTDANLRSTVWSMEGTIAGERMIMLPWRSASANGPFEQVSCFPCTTHHRWVSIVLTIAHLNHDATDNRDANLAALCQWCHLAHDRRFHHANARRTRANAIGQLWLSKQLEQANVPPLEVNPEIARCDREIDEIRNRADVVAGHCPAWLVTLGLIDWEMEKRLIEGGR
jgi:5-methylcytosine-specific restriction endonuclease McrA